MLLGELPWKQLVNDKTIIVYKQAIMHTNASYDLPTKIIQFLNIVNNVEYKATPPYRKLQQLLNSNTYNKTQLKDNICI